MQLIAAIIPTAIDTLAPELHSIANILVNDKVNESLDYLRNIGYVPMEGLGSRRAISYDYLIVYTPKRKTVAVYKHH